MNKYQLTVAALVLAGGVGVAHSQDQGTSGQTITIPKEQYQKLLDEHEKLLKEMEEFRAFKAQMQQQMEKVVPAQAETDKALDDIEKEIKDVKKTAKESFPGSTKLLVGGYGSATFTSKNDVGNKAFSATFNPIFLWKLSDRLLFEGEFEAELAGTTTSVSLEMAQLSYLLNDYVTIGAGKFLNPENYFVERQHMAWVNKLPDKPLAVYDGLLPEALEGVQVRGAIPLGPTKLSYAVFAANSPLLNSDPGTVASPADPTTFGGTEFDNFDNVNGHISYGGRIGFSPMPELEFGFGAAYSDVTPSGSLTHVQSFTQSADLSYVRDSEKLMGVINVKGQWVWSHLSDFTYDPTGIAGGPYTFNNSRNGGYAQIAYRATHAENSFLKNLEPVFRYDHLGQLRTPTGLNETRYTLGLNYWLGASSVIKLAYEIDHQTGPSAAYHDNISLQFATGF